MYIFNGVVLAPGIRNTTQVVTRDGLIALLGLRSQWSQNPIGLILYLNVTAVPGVDTVTAKIQECDESDESFFDFCSALPLAAIGRQKIKVFPATPAVAASLTGCTVQDVLPANWRLGIQHSGAGNFNYSVGMAILGGQ